MSDWITRSLRRFCLELVDPAGGQWKVSPFAYLLTWLSLPLPVSVVLIHQLGSWYLSPWGFALIIALTAVGLLTSSWRQIRAGVSGIDWSGDWRPHWAWGLVILAVAMRYLLLDYLPPPHPIIEEIQTGGIAARSLTDGVLTLDFRFTNWMAAVGFKIAGYSLEGLRSLFGLAGGLSIVFMALTLRRLNVGWPAVILAVFTMASLRILVLGGNTAEEVFSGIIFETLLLYCTVSSHAARNNRPVWAGFAGIIAGALMYEYAPYKWVIAVPVATWLWQALTSSERDERRAALWSGSCYALCLTLVGAPVIADFAKDPKNSYLLEIFVRHSQDRPSPLTNLSELNLSAMKMLDYAQVLIGQSNTPASLLYREPHGPVVPGLAGMAFAASFLYTFWRSRVPMLRIAALIAFFVLATFALVANNFNAGILVPIVVLLVLLLGVAADDLTRALWRSDRWRPAAFYLPALVVIMVVLNIASVIRMASDPAVLREFANNQYSVCRAIGEESLGYDSVILASYGGLCSYNDEKWLYPDSDAPIHISENLPESTEIPPGALVVLGHAHGLNDGQIGELTRLAVQLNSVHTLRRTLDLLGKTSAVSFCYQCRTPSE